MSRSERVVDFQGLLRVLDQDAPGQGTCGRLDSVLFFESLDDTAPKIRIAVEAPDRDPDSSRVPSRSPTDLAPLLQIDDGQLLNQLPLWSPDARLRRKILVENPASLYGF